MNLLVKKCIFCSEEKVKTVRSHITIRCHLQFTHNCLTKEMIILSLKFNTPLSTILAEEQRCSWVQETKYVQCFYFCTSIFLYKMYNLWNDYFHIWRILKGFFLFFNIDYKNGRPHIKRILAVRGSIFMYVRIIDNLCTEGGFWRFSLVRLICILPIVIQSKLWVYFSW